MVAEQDAAALRATVERDLATFKAQRERLYQLQVHPEGIQRSDRNMIINWSRDALKGYARQLETMENKDSHSPEDKVIMRELNTLLVVGDQLAEIMNKFAEAYEDKFGKITFSAEEEERTKTLRSTSSRQKSAEPEDELSSLRQAPAAPASASTARASGSTKASPNMKAAEDEAKEATTTLEAAVSGLEIAIDNDPKGIYALLGLSPPISFAVVQKAIRKKQMALHPDKNPNDPTAADRFASFMTLAEKTFGTAEKKAEYDGGSFQE